MLKQAEQQISSGSSESWSVASAESAGSDSSARDVVRRQSKRVLCDLAIVTDIVAVIAGALAGLWLYLDRYPHGQNLDQIYIWATLTGALVAAALFRFQGLYEFENLRTIRRQVPRIVIGMGATTLLLTGLGFFLKVSPEVSRGWFIVWVSCATVGIFLSRLVVARMIDRWTRQGLFRQRVAIYGAGEGAQRLIGKMKDMGDLVRIKGIYYDLRPDEDLALSIDGGLRDLIRRGQQNQFDEIVVAVRCVDEAFVTNILDQLSVLPVDVRLVPDMMGWIRPRGLVTYNGVSSIEIHKRPLDDWGPILKSLEDRIIGGLALFLAAPALAAIAIAVKLSSPGPVFFRQRRHGFNHQVFHVLKFRTMTVTEDGPTIKQATKDDDRITKVGRFLRRTSLDELPQLINVVRGEMSLVGPRPHAIAHNEYYSDLLDRYANRHKMKPGITGWAQVNGYRGETDTPEKMRARVEHDLHYIENWSLLLDLKILILTPIYGFVHRNAF